MVLQSLPSFSYCFYFQYYFIVVYQYLSSKSQEKSVKQIIGTTYTVIYIYLILVCFFAVKAGIVFAKLDSLTDVDSPLGDQYAQATIFLISSFLQIPFNFFLGKEFLLSAYDEIRYRRLSKKIDDLKYGLGTHAYQTNMIEKV